MFRSSHAFSGFSVDNIDSAKEFYGHKLGLRYSEGQNQLHLHLTGGANVFVYPKPDHRPATFTILTFPVNDIMAIIDGLKTLGIAMEIYPEYLPYQDEHGVYRNGGWPPIAWFRDPARNILSLIEN